MEALHYVVPLAPITKKNSQQIIYCGGRPRVIPSRAYLDYRDAALLHLRRRVQPIDEPVTVRCIFYRKSARRTDLTNLLEAIDDILVDAGILKDDNCSIIASHDGSRVRLDREHPRTEIWIEPYYEGD